MFYMQNKNVHRYLVAHSAGKVKMKRATHFTLGFFRRFILPFLSVYLTEQRGKLPNNKLVFQKIKNM